MTPLRQQMHDAMLVRGLAERNRRMVDKHAALLHHFLNMPVAQWIRHVQTNAHQDYVYRKAHSFCIEHVSSYTFY